VIGVYDIPRFGSRAALATGRCGCRARRLLWSGMYAVTAPYAVDFDAEFACARSCSLLKEESDCDLPAHGAAVAPALRWDHHIAATLSDPPLRCQSADAFPNAPVAELRQAVFRSSKARKNREMMMTAVEDADRDHTQCRRARAVALQLFMEEEGTSRLAIDIIYPLCCCSSFPHF
jgi:hypothetical protein